MPDKPKAPESTSFPVRLTKADHQWLVALAQENGVEVSQIIRWAVTAFRQYVEAHDGKLHLPINIQEYWGTIASTFPPIKPDPERHQPSLRAAEEPEPSPEAAAPKKKVNYKDHNRPSKAG